MESEILFRKNKNGNYVAGAHSIKHEMLQEGGNKSKINEDEIEKIKKLSVPVGLYVSNTYSNTLFFDNDSDSDNDSHYHPNDIFSPMKEYKDVIDNDIYDNLLEDININRIEDNEDLNDKITINNNKNKNKNIEKNHLKSMKMNKSFSKKNKTNYTKSNKNKLYINKNKITKNKHKKNKKTNKIIK